MTAARVRPRWRRVVVAGAVLLAGAAVAVGHRVVGIGTGFFAKQLCSGVFVSGRDADAVVRDDLHRYPPAIVLTRIDWRVDRERRTVEADWFGVARWRAAWRPGAGCALDAPPVAAGQRLAAPTAPRDPRPWPAGDAVSPPDTIRGRPRAALDAVVARAFAPGRETRAVVVVIDGAIVAERYADGFGPDVPLPGWSMAKSVMQAMVGVLVRERQLDLDAPLGLAVWSASDDPRRGITFRHALTMTTGLAFDEGYANPLSDVTRMLFESADAAGFAASKRLATPPGTQWAYTSGTTNLVSAALRERVGSEVYGTLPQRLVFEPLGMRSAVFETDAAGTFIGSSFLYATARDWARFGLLYANDGEWNGQRMLPAGWVRWSRTPVPESAGRYGAHFWIGEGDERATPTSRAPALEDAFHAAGHAGQLVTIVPSRRLVVVRLGLDVGVERWDQRGFVRDIAAAVAEVRSR